MTQEFRGRIYGDIVENNKSRQAMRRLMNARRAEKAAAQPPRPEAIQAPVFASAPGVSSAVL